MAELPPCGARIAAEVGRIAAGAGPINLEERARALMAELRRVVPFEAGWIGLLDPERREHVPLSVQGYDDRSRDYITTPAIVEDIELLGLDRPGRPLRLRDSRSRPRRIAAGRSTWHRPGSARPSRCPCSLRMGGISGCSRCTPTPRRIRPTPPGT